MRSIKTNTKRTNINENVSELFNNSFLRTRIPHTNDSPPSRVVDKLSVRKRRYVLSSRMPGMDGVCVRCAYVLFYFHFFHHKFLCVRSAYVYKQTSRPTNRVEAHRPLRSISIFFDTNDIIQQ